MDHFEPDQQKALPNGERMNLPNSRRHKKGNDIVTTVRERLIALAETELERKLVALWMDDDHNENCSRQRAWQEVDRRLARGEARYSW